ncbi:MAG: SMP-30/gluconolactonase/LRE family protein [Bacteroidota bacterium]
MYSFNKFISAIVITAFALSTSVFAQEEVEVNFVKIAEGLQFPEGPAWDGHGNLYISNCYGNWITRINNDVADTFVVAPTSPIAFEKTNGLTVFHDKSIYACDYGLGAILKFSPKGECTIYASGFNGEKFNRPNDLAFDWKRNLYFTDPKSYGKDILDGRIFRVDYMTKEVSLVYEGLAFPNGIAFSPDGEFLYVSESAKERILVFLVKEDGTLSEPKVLVELPGGDPDGLAIDGYGNIYAAHFGGGAIFVIRPNGELIYKIKTPGKKPSNLEFAGEDLSELYITEDETNCVYKVKLPNRGLRLFSAPGIE